MYKNQNYYYSYPNYSNVDVDILSTSKHPVRKYSLEGKTFIEGKKGSEFSIRIKNPNSMRVEVVVSVDGLCVIDGKKASSDSHSYVISAYDTLIINGWRINNDEVRKFYFTDKGNSYSGIKNGDEENCGIISVLAYAEYVKPVRISLITSEVPYIPFYTLTSAGNCSNITTSNYKCTTGGQYLSQTKNAVMDSVDSFDLGTGMGEKQDSKVVSTHFDRDRFLGKTSIFYASRTSLIDMGVDVEKKHMIRLPQGFTDFCEEI
jgi:hypothetical protein